VKLYLPDTGVEENAESKRAVTDRLDLVDWAKLLPDAAD